MRVIFVIVCMFLSAQAFAQKDTSTMATDVYKGVLPCADCSGLQTELTLFHAANAGMGSYILKETYMGKDRVVETKGEWTHHRGIPGNKNATVFDLYNAAKPDADSRYFLQLKDGSIKLLDKDLKMIKSEGNYILKKEK